MIRKILFTLFSFLILTVEAFAVIDIVYPAGGKELTINAKSTFFIGNTNKGSTLFINGNQVKLWEDNFFVQVVPLEYGRNTVNIVSNHDGTSEAVTYYINRKKPAAVSSYHPAAYTAVQPYTYAKTIKSNATVREKPTTASGRIVDLPANVVLYIKGKQGDYYQIDAQGQTQFWIHKNNISKPSYVETKNEPQILHQKTFSDGYYDYAKFELTYPVLYTTKQNGNNVDLTMYGVKSQKSDGTINPNTTYTFSMGNNVLGYDCIYEGNYLVIKMSRPPKVINESLPLEGVSIFIDPGHGGKEKGSVGPTRVAEKDINLAISKYLINELTQAGATVTTSRTTDIQVPLYERVKMGKNNNAFISISIHSNALPNGKDPYISHGTEVHYYNDNAKLLAETIKNGLVNDLNLKDNGIHRSSFALDRSTNPISVLVEVAYMIYPEEYIRLKNPEFQKNVAKSIKKSIETYINMLKK